MYLFSTSANFSARTRQNGYPLVICDIAIEHGPLAIVSFPIKHGDVNHSYLKLPEGTLCFFHIDFLWKPWPN